MSKKTKKDLNKIVRDGACADAYDKVFHCLMLMPAVHYVRHTQNRAVASRRYTYANPDTGESAMGNLRKAE